MLPIVIVLNKKKRHALRQIRNHRQQLLEDLVPDQSVLNPDLASAAPNRNVTRRSVGTVAAPLSSDSIAALKASSSWNSLERSIQELETMPGSFQIMRIIFLNGGMIAYYVYCVVNYA